jgi:hypothetical protein
VDFIYNNIGDASEAIKHLVSQGWGFRFDQKDLNCCVVTAIPPADRTNIRRDNECVELLQKYF